MTQSQALTSPSTATMIGVPPVKDTIHIDMSRETTIAESVSTKLSGLEGLREKMSPMLLYVVSTAQFLDIGMYSCTGSLYGDRGLKNTLYIHPY